MTVQRCHELAKSLKAEKLLPAKVDPCGEEHGEAGAVKALDPYQDFEPCGNISGRVRELEMRVAEASAKSVNEMAEWKKRKGVKFSWLVKNFERVPQPPLSPRSQSNRAKMVQELKLKFGEVKPVRVAGIDFKTDLTCPATPAIPKVTSRKTGDLISRRLSEIQSPPSLRGRTPLDQDPVASIKDSIFLKSRQAASVDHGLPGGATGEAKTVMVEAGTGAALAGAALAGAALAGAGATEIKATGDGGERGHSVGRGRSLSSCGASGTRSVSRSCDTRTKMVRSRRAMERAMEARRVEDADCRRMHPGLAISEQREVSDHGVQLVSPGHNELAESALSAANTASAGRITVPSGLAMGLGVAKMWEWVFKFRQSLGEAHKVAKAHVHTLTTMLAAMSNPVSTNVVKFDWLAWEGLRATVLSEYSQITTGLQNMTHWQTVVNRLAQQLNVQLLAAPTGDDDRTFTLSTEQQATVEAAANWILSLQSLPTARTWDKLLKRMNAQAVVSGGVDGKPLHFNIVSL
ncbi:hypothetical protein GNI_127260 [Gregarina niphandrodes]|uniref:Uncharacterized protein n=1 Tax=Gregarina niphandrodes TaxID=110365 RepID=A0A023B2D0_GRENI|nr:hypothetical protein GNI_127260 [Gregarina niphandrodes]EZG49311.1 hypothetical protein GNI_127260 [Gregarina niphandrodes]|eukprot:XP_011132047.1 hypothetical protein GNI_127260 [Gregarina niphandrodes]